MIEVSDDKTEELFIILCRFFCIFLIQAKVHG